MGLLGEVCLAQSGDSNVWVTLFLLSPCADPLRLLEVGSQSYLLTSWTPDGIDF